MPEYTTDHIRYWGDEWVDSWSEGHWDWENIARCTLKYLKLYTNFDVCSGLSESDSYRYRTERIFGVEWTPHEADGATNYVVSCGFSERAWLESEWARDRLEKFKEPYWSNELIVEGFFRCGCISSTLFKMLPWIDSVERRWDRIVG
ncbi:hypothetical protein FACUT_1722 [Fusarium acutatum]|uniref:Uncharacterized protein n=1 Tax=Fusarium acutatum TaxID=78861 RepID=A0A8H4K5I4_9HYPO|nr:hypothetical protein FACUT_1722 [Fusarium acutatum]